jgi:hypothetical protein
MLGIGANTAIFKGRDRGELTPPEAVGQEHDPVAAGLDIVLGEATAQRRFDAEHRKETRPDLKSFDLNRRRVGRDIERHATENSDLFKGVPAVPPRHVVDRRHGGRGAPQRPIDALRAE